jgi:AcrR family transcriptional regulator
MKSRIEPTPDMPSEMPPDMPVAPAGGADAAGRTADAGGKAAGGDARTRPADAVAPAQRRWRGRRAPRHSRREEILRSVADVLRDSRLTSLTMRSIAEELGITKGNLYYYFRDKQDILYHCHMRCMELSLDALREAQAASGSPRARLRELLLRHIRGILEEGLGNILLTDLENLTIKQRANYVAKRDHFESGVRALIEAGIQAGEFRCDNVKLASLTLLGAINWTSKWYQPDGELSAARIAAGMADFLIRGLDKP